MSPPCSNSTKTAVSATKPSHPGWIRRRVSRSQTTAGSSAMAAPTEVRSILSLRFAQRAGLLQPDSQLVQGEIVDFRSEASDLGGLAIPPRTPALARPDERRSEIARLGQCLFIAEPCEIATSTARLIRTGCSAAGPDAAAGSPPRPGPIPIPHCVAVRRPPNARSAR